MSKISRIAAGLASAAALSLAATPALANGHDGWGRGWDGGRRHHDDGIDGGDILTGLLILGGIAVIAGAASSGNDRQRERQADYPDPPEPQPAYAGYGDDTRPQWHDNGGINAAVGRCMDEIDRGRTRVDSVDSVSRSGDGWRVEGRADGGSPFSCTVGADGQIRQVSVDGRAL